MFGNQFYPTPDSLVQKMIEPYFKTLKSKEHGWEHRYLKADKILEPSAGKGNILDYLCVHGMRDKKQNIACCELDPELRMILGGKRYRVVDSDFLTYEPDNESFDLIIMNPPFKDGVDHILKAWEIASKHVVCVLNAETIRNPYTEKRQLLRELIERYGKYEFHCEQFVDAENPTDVEIAIVWLEKPEVQPEVEFDEEYEKEFTPNIGEFNENALASRNLIEALVQQYESAKALLVEIHQLGKKYNFYTKDLSKNHEEKETVHGSLKESVDNMKRQFWRYVFDKTNLGRKTTSKFQKDFDTFTTSTQDMAFSVNNIVSVLDLFRMNIGSIMERCLLEAFDAACAYHSDNKIHREGWKTNDSYRCAKKIIMPYGIRYDKDSYSPWCDYWSRSDFFTDLDKVMCFLTGRDIEHIRSIAWAVQERIRYLNSNQSADHRMPFESSFFEIKIFKKGTIHIEFHDEDLWNRFNIEAAKGKNWLPAKEEGGFEQKTMF